VYANFSNPRDDDAVAESSKQSDQLFGFSVERKEAMDTRTSQSLLEIGSAQIVRRISVTHRLIKICNLLRGYAFHILRYLEVQFELLILAPVRQ